MSIWNDAPHRELAAAFILLAGAGLLSGPAQAQTQDQQYEFFLYAKCDNMDFVRDADLNLLPGQAGLRLNAYCSGRFELPSGVSESSFPPGGINAGAGFADQAARRRRAAEGEEGDDITLFSSGQYSAYATLNYSRETQDETGFEGWHRSSTLGVSVGLDRRLGTSGVVGIAALAEDLSGDLREDGKFDHRAYGAQLYGSWLPTPALFIDAALGWTTRNVDTRRTVSFRRLVTFNEIPPRTEIFTYIPAAPASSDVDNEDQLAELRAGYDFSFGAYTVGPRFAGSYRKTDIDEGYETGPTPMTLVIDEQTEKSLRAGAGLQASRVFNSNVAVWVLQLNADFWHEFKDDQRYITARLAEDLRPDPSILRYQNEAPDRNTCTARLSLSATMPHGWSAFASVDALLGHDYLSRHGAAIGLRKEL